MTDEQQKLIALLHKELTKKPNRQTANEIPLLQGIHRRLTEQEVQSMAKR